MAKNIIVITGASDSGKDQMSSFCIDELSKFNKTASVVKWTDQYKRQMEFLYSLPFGALNDKAFRDQEVTDPFGKKLGITYIDLMVKWSMIKDEVDPHFVTRNVVPIIINCPSDVVILNDTRFPCEVDCLVQMRKRGLVETIHSLKLSRPGESVRDSDKYLLPNWARLMDFSCSYREYSNNKTLTELRGEANILVHNLIDSIENGYCSNTTYTSSSK